MKQCAIHEAGLHRSTATISGLIVLSLLTASCGGETALPDNGTQVAEATTTTAPNDSEEAQPQDEADNQAPVEDHANADTESTQADAASPKLGQPLETALYDFTRFLKAPVELVPHEPVFFAHGELGHVRFFSEDVSVSVWNLGSWNTRAEATTATVDGQLTVHPTDIVGSIPAAEIDAWIASNSIDVAADRSSTVAGTPARVIDLTVSDDAETVVEPADFLMCGAGCIFYADPPVALLEAWGSAPVRVRPMLDTSLLYRFWFIETPTNPVLIVAESETTAALDIVEAELIPTVKIRAA